MQQVISTWARQEYGSREYMCPAGKKVYDIIVGLEAKDKMPAEIVSFFERKNKKAIKTFVVDRVESREDTPDYEDHISSLEDVQKGDWNYINKDLHSAAFEKALKAEIKRLKALADAPNPNFQGTPVFTLKNNGRVEVKFKGGKKSKRRK